MGRFSAYLIIVPAMGGTGALAGRLTNPIAGLADGALKGLWTGGVLGGFLEWCLVASIIRALLPRNPFGVSGGKGRAASGRERRST